MPSAERRVPSGDMDRDDIVFSEKDEPLRADVHWLGALVGDVIREQGGVALFEAVENARRAAIRRREGDSDAESVLAGIIGERGPEDAARLVRSFTLYFRVVNRAEQVHRIRRRRAYDRDPRTPPPGSLWEALQTLRSAGVTEGAVRQLLARLTVEPVFTAHPTEATRRTIRQKEQRLARRLLERENPSLTPPERAVLEAQIRLEITTAWQTAEYPAVRPTVTDEREHVLFYLTERLYDVVPAFHERLEEALARSYGAGAVDALVAPVLRFGTWVGGDMDGNPNVSATTIRETLARQRELIVLRYRRELGALAEVLSQSRSRVAVSAAVDRRLAAYEARFPDGAAAIPGRHRDMPYRVLCRMMQARLDATLAGEDGAYGAPEEFIGDLETIAASLRDHEGAHAGLFLVRRALWRARTFGFHLATLDARQDAVVHRTVAAGDAPDEEVERTLEVFRALGECQARYGPGAVGPFIISMAARVDDVLLVLRLARRAGLVDGDGVVPLDVAPLFETVDDLRRAADTMRALLADPEYAPHLDARGRRQMVMVGYSDSSKDGGLVASRWALQRAQAALTAVARDARVDLTIFHGRGGTIGRGGGKTHHAVLAMPPGSVNGRLRVTEQGEVIDGKYGLRGIAFRTLERAAGAVMLATASPPSPDPREEQWHAVAALVADASRAAYRALVHEHPRFVEYFRTATPIDLIERLAIGSRPASRRRGAGIDDLRAIPWVFAWTQSRHVLPGWYGLGAGLGAAEQAFGREALTEMAEAWPFFRTLLDDAEMALAKADMAIAARYAELAGDLGAQLFGGIRDEFDRTVERLLALRGGGALLDRDPALQRSIRLRNPYVDPMSFLQIDLLRRWREAGSPAGGALFEALLETVNGIAEGLQNTG